MIPLLLCLLSGLSLACSSQSINLSTKDLRHYTFLEKGKLITANDYGHFAFNPNQCDVWGALPGAGVGAPGAPPIYLGSEAKFSSKIMFPWKVASIPTHLTLFQKFFSITPPKISENWKSSEKLLKMGEIFKICNFWAISTCNTSKKRIFHIECNFKQKKYELFEKNAKKSNF